ncbi:MAG TPA: SRPBCC family protein, partial [Polyangiaceae bacterium]
IIEVSPELVWKAWTEPEHLKPWFTPRPWTTTECEIDLRPGGVFRTVMRSPEGQLFPNQGCYLEVVPKHKLVWTDALQGEYRPSKLDPHLGFHFTATLLFEPSGKGTKYTAIVLHGDEESRSKHDAMGFKDGWGAALDQLVEYMKAV